MLIEYSLNYYLKFYPLNYLNNSEKPKTTSSDSLYCLTNSPNPHILGAETNELLALVLDK